MAKEAKAAPKAKVKDAPKAEEKAVAKVASKAVVEFSEELADLAGAGIEEARQSDVALPMIRIVQLLSPQMDPKKPEYLPDAEAGDIINSATQELYSGEEGVLFIPCFFKSAFLEWWPRDSKEGKGFVKEWPIDSDIMSKVERNERGQDMTERGTYVIDTAHHYGLLIEADGTPTPCVITMASTQRKKSKQWITRQMAIKTKIPNPATGREELKTAPTFMVAYRLKSTAESNDRGRWNGWVIEMERVLDVQGNEADRELFLAGLSFYKTCKEGLVTVRHDEPEDGIGGEASGAGIM